MKLLSTGIFLLSLWLSTVPILAQSRLSTLRGKLINREGVGIASASLRLKGTRLGTITNGEGWYEIRFIPSGRHTLVISHVGYIKTTVDLLINAAEMVNQPIVLQTKLNELSEVIVEGKASDAAQTRIIDNLRKSAMAVTVIDARQFAGRSITLNEILNQQSGMRIRQSGGVGGSSQVSLRGLEGKRVQLYIDDNPVYAPDGSLSVNDLSINNFSRVEVYKGFVPAFLGADGLGGAVNLVSQQRYQEQLDVSVMRSSYNVNNLTAFYRKNLLKPGISLSVGGTATGAENNYVMKSRGEYQPGLAIIRDHDRYQNFIGTVGVEFDKAGFDDFRVELTHYENEKQLQGVATNIRHAFTTSNVWAGVLNLKKKDFLVKGLDFRFSFIGSHAKARFIDTASYRVDFYGKRVEVQGEVQEYRKDATNLQDDFRGRTNLQYQINTKTSLNFNNVTRIARLNPNDPLLNAVAGRNVSHFPGELRSTVFGLTYEANLFTNRFQNLLIAKYYNFYSASRTADIKFITELFTLPDPITNQLANVGYGDAMRYVISPTLLIRSSFERAFRMPQPSELFGNGLAIAPNNKLRPEQAYNLNVGIRYDKPFANQSRLQVEISGFASNLVDYIQVGPGPSFVTGSFINYPKAHLRGGELEIKADLGRLFFASFNTTLQSLRDESDFILGTSIPNFNKGLRIPNSPFFFTNFSAEFHKANLFGGKGQQTRVIYDNNFTARFTYDFEVPNTFTTYAIPGYMTHAVSVEQGFNQGMFVVGGEVYNLTNALIINNLNNPLPGRVFRLKLRYVWKKALPKSP